MPPVRQSGPGRRLDPDRWETAEPRRVACWRARPGGKGATAALHNMPGHDSSRPPIHCTTADTRPAVAAPIFPCTIRPDQGAATKTHARAGPMFFPGTAGVSPICANFADNSAIFLLPCGTSHFLRKCWGWREAPDEGLDLCNSSATIELSALTFRPSSPCRDPKHFQRKCGVPNREKAGISVMLAHMGETPAVPGETPTPKGRVSTCGRGVSRAEGTSAHPGDAKGRVSSRRPCDDLGYSVKPKFSMWRLRVGVMIEPVTFLFIR
ncbi:hypothetical protein J3R73_000720 [Labrys monachus]|uniref:Uncharacterized protein n=1 Tax=Labrys monachus TaxID=217067 RepID=A0ABU0F8H9_9HYPH|nr:hypothetical protein [Labrys monachus]